MVSVWPPPTATGPSVTYGTPKFVQVPLVRIDAKELDAWLATMPVGGAANPFYSQAYVAAMIDAAINHTAPPPKAAKQ